MKLDYLKLINQFWQLRRSKRITNLQSDLYFFLLQECNMKYWENPFECSNVLIKASIGISEPSLIDARNKLKQLQLIDFEPGKRKEQSPVYHLLYLNNFSINRVKGIVKPLVKTEEKPLPSLKQETTPKPQKTKQPAKPAPVLFLSSIVIPWETPEFLKQWDRWKEYKKKQHRFTFKSEDSEQAALLDLAKISDGVEANAIELINHAIAKGWKGIFKISNNQNGNKQGSNKINGNDLQTMFAAIDQKYK